MMLTVPPRDKTMYPNTDRCPLSIVNVCSISGGAVVLAFDAPV
jgi:hypothetical protein